MSSKQNGCKRQLTQRDSCTGQCERPNREDDTNEVPPECALTEWSEFSECSVKCGMGVMVRSREYVLKSAKKRCQRTTADPPPLQQTRNCQGMICGGDITEAPETAGYPFGNKPEEEEDENPFYPRPVDDHPRACRMSEWSLFSPCNKNCDQGVRMRYRYPLGRDLDVIEVQLRATDVFSNLHYEGPRMRDDEDEEFMEEKKIFTPLQPDGQEHEFMKSGCAQLFCFSYSDPCANHNFFETVECDKTLPRCVDVPADCFQEPVFGSCRIPQTRWYFDYQKNTCGLFSYSGCNGNGNNFVSQEECLNTCKFLQSPETNSFNDMTVSDHRRQEDAPRDCLMSAWERGPCNASCGEGMRRKIRRVISPAKNGGSVCPRKTVRHERCRLPSCENRRHDTRPSRDPGYNMY